LGENISSHHCSCIQQSGIRNQTTFNIFSQATTTAHKLYKHEIELKLGRYKENTKTLASLTLIKLAKRNKTLRKSTTAPGTN